MFFELRQYKIHPGQIDNWVAYMEEVIIPFQKSKGMNIVGSFRVEDDPETFVWIRRFDSEEQRAQQYEAVYQSEHWTQNIAPQIPDMLDRSGIKVSRIVPTDTSAMR